MASSRDDPSRCSTVTAPSRRHKDIYKTVGRFTVLPRALPTAISKFKERNSCLLLESSKKHKSIFSFANIDSFLLPPNLTFKNGSQDWSSTVSPGKLPSRVLLAFKTGRLSTAGVGRNQQRVVGLSCRITDGSTCHIVSTKVRERKSCSGRSYRPNRPEFVCQ